MTGTKASTGGRGGHPVVFDLYPHRSLSGRGFLVVMALIGVLSLAIGIGFLLVGAGR